MIIYLLDLFYSKFDIKKRHFFILGTSIQIRKRERQNQMGEFSKEFDQKVERENRVRGFRSGRNPEQEN